MSISLSGLQHMIAPGTCESAVKVRVSGHLQSWVGQEEREDLLETLPNVLPDYLYLLVLAFLHLGCGEEWGGEEWGGEECGEERVERGVGRRGWRGVWGGEGGEGHREERRAERERYSGKGLFMTERKQSHGVSLEQALASRTLFRYSLPPSAPNSWS